ncbi:MAG: hypothetical protein V4671_22815, partial [Armatimonadota bacterium]
MTVPIRDEDLPPGIVRSKPVTSLPSSPLPPFPLPSEGEEAFEAKSNRASRKPKSLGRRSAPGSDEDEIDVVPNAP